MNAMDIAAALGLLLVLLLGCQGLRRVLPWLDALFIPTSIVAGTLGLLLGPQVLGQLMPGAGGWRDGLFGPTTLEVWRAVPGLLISVVFASLFIGKPLPAVRDVWRASGPQVVLGYTFSFGQYAVGLLAVVLLLTPVFGVDPLAGLLIEVALTGGHGTAAGMAPTFEKLDFAEATDMALAMATVGLVAGVILGTVFINIAARHPGLIPPADDGDEALAAAPDLAPASPRPSRVAMDPLSFHAGLIALAVFLGAGLRSLLMLLEDLSWGRITGPLMAYVPLFPFAMLGGAFVQLVAQRGGWAATIHRPHVARIGGVSLDLIIVAALGSLSLSALSDNFVAFVVLAGLGIAWTVLVFWWLAPRIIPEQWFTKALGDFGQASGMAVTGLLLMGVADPHHRTRALEGFGYKQLLFEPMVGGGLITALAPVLLMQLGAPLMAALFTVATLSVAILGVVLARRSTNRGAPASL